MTYSRGVAKMPMKFITQLANWREWTTGQNCTVEHREPALAQRPQHNQTMQGLARVLGCYIHAPDSSQHKLISERVLLISALHRNHL